jgi:hypothetical protein
MKWSALLCQDSQKLHQNFGSSTSLATFTQFERKSRLTPEVPIVSTMYSVLMPYFPPLLLVALNRSISIFFPTTVPFSSTGMKFCCLVHKPHRYSYKKTDDSNLKASRLVSNTSIHYITKRLKQLQENPCPMLAESIDKDLTQGMLSSEKKCRSHGEDPWSLVLQQARLRVDIFRHALSMVRLGMENNHKI